MAKEILISTSPHETKIALLEDGQLVEFYVEREREIGLAGSIYKGRVTRVLPGMQSAFVDVGLERDAFLYVSDYFEELEELADTERVELPEPATPAPGAESGSPAGSAAEASAGEEAAGARDTPFDAELQPGNVREAEAPAAAPGADADERQPDSNESRPPSFDDDRQPPFLSHEPPLRLPETRPLGGGRGPRRHRGGRRRGGRGRPRSLQGPMADRSAPQRRPWDKDRRDRGPRPPREPREPRDFSQPPSGEPNEPIILPGESLAKYRDRAPARPADSPAPSAPMTPPAEPEIAATESPETPELSAQAAPVIEDRPQPEFAPAKPEAAPLPKFADETEEEEEPEEEQTTAEGSSDELEEPAAEPVEAPEDEEPFLPDSVQAEPLSEPAAEESGPEHMEAGAYNGAEGPTLAEVEQVRRSQEQTDLPPSVHERTGDAVEWTQTQNRAGRPERGGRDRFSRGGRRGRGGRG
ncbi:MAG: hypothetical protein ACRD4U_09380, partial [Candidatus Acidiferrales bacterium]